MIYLPSYRHLAPHLGELGASHLSAAYLPDSNVTFDASEFARLVISPQESVNDPGRLNNLALRDTWTKHAIVSIVDDAEDQVRGLRA